MSEADLLFELIDNRLDRATRVICGAVYAQRPEVSWESEQRMELVSAVRKELDAAIQGFLGALDNVGGVLPDSIGGWQIRRVEDGKDLRVDCADYADMWLDYLWRKANEGKS